MHLEKLFTRVRRTITVLQLPVRSGPGWDGLRVTARPLNVSDALHVEKSWECGQACTEYGNA